VSLPVNFSGREWALATLRIVEPPGNHPLIRVKFNPTQYVRKKENTFAEIQVPGLESPPLQYVRGGAETLSMDLLVDTSDTLENVREKYVDGVRNLLNQDGKLHAPPIVAFEWDEKTIFKGVLTSLEVTYTLFDVNGTPLRAKLAVMIKEYRPIAIQYLETGAKQTSPDVEKRYVARAGETLSSISAAVFRDPSQWREIALANAIADPRRIAPGTVLTIPRLTDGLT
jgi:nucleoid-associated protein YgaU